MKQLLQHTLLILMTISSLLVPPPQPFVTIETVSPKHSTCCCKGHACSCDATKSACCTLDSSSKSTADSEPTWMSVSCAVQPYDSALSPVVPNKLFLLPILSPLDRNRPIERWLRSTVDKQDSLGLPPLDRPPQFS